jgi:PAS domain S-box-containing protein
MPTRRRPAPLVLLGELETAVLDALPISIYVVDRELRVVGWNRGREQGPQGIPRAEVLGRSLRRVFPAAAFRATSRQIERVLRSRRQQTETVETNSGRLYEVGRFPVFNGRKLTHVLCNFEDVTDRREIELKMIASDRLAFLGQLVAGVAHEVSNPLAGIAGCAEALASIGMQVPHKVARRQAKEFRDLIRGEVARCERIIRTLLDAARPGPGETAGILEHVESALRLLERHPAFSRVKVRPRVPRGCHRRGSSPTRSSRS